ncbi:MAG: MarR family winged helix-turn-helix transcriptional regulator [Lysobacterales bacterium]
MAASEHNAKIGPLHPDFQLDDYVLYNLIRLSSTYTAEMEQALKRHQLSTTEWRILSLLKDRNPSTVGDLARRSVTKLPTVTRMLGRMEKSGLVVRDNSSADRRVVEVSMTAEAEATLALVRTIGQRVFEKAFDGVDEEQIAQMTALLKTVRENLSRSPYEDQQPALAGDARR